MAVTLALTTAAACAEYEDDATVAAPAATYPPDPAVGLAAWSTFPADRSPRPLVVLQPDVSDPADGFRTGEDKEAYLDGRIVAPATFPATPSSAGGYPVVPAADAVAELAHPPSGSGSATGTLVVTGVTLAEHTYSTDRGDVVLPAWAVTLANVSDPAYVLAVAPAARFAHENDGSRWDGAGAVAVRGDRLTVAFTAEHESTGPCDLAYTQTIDVVETPAVVQLVVTTHQAPPGTPDPSSEPVTCNLALPLTLTPPLVPGTPGTSTQTLAADLGNRPVVDAAGLPWKVAVVG